MENIVTAKVLLFGEYSVIDGGQALAIPFSKYSGMLKLNDQSSPLSAFVEYLVNHRTQFINLNIDKLKQDVGAGLFFESNIPIGAGLGSSGALCAAIYRGYLKKPESDIYELKQILADMENYFHQQSSGIDPLVSYLGQTVLFDTGKISILPKVDSYKGLSFFLLKTGSDSHSTGKLMDDYRSLATEQRLRLVSLSDQCIQKRSSADLWNSFKELSIFQRSKLSPMILDKVENIWDEGIKDEKYLLKICGAGRNHYLGVTPNRQNLNSCKFEVTYLEL